MVGNFRSLNPNQSAGRILSFAVEDSPPDTFTRLGNRRMISQKTQRDLAGVGLEMEPLTSQPHPAKCCDPPPQGTVR